MAAYHHRTLLVGDIKTHFLEAGSGPDLVLLHGGEYGASAEITWRHNIETLGRNFHVVAPDILGWGQTDKLYSFSDPAGLRIKHLQRFLETLGIGKAFFVGNSAGGGLILRASVRHPAPLQIHKMVTICGNASVFKTNSQADLENYTPSLDNMKKIVATALPRRQMAHATRTSASATRARSSPAPGKRSPPRACAVRCTRRARRRKNSSSSFRN